MSDSAVLDQLKISQSMRFYWYEYRLPPPIPQDEIIRHSTNLHIIPADRCDREGMSIVARGRVDSSRRRIGRSDRTEYQGTWRSSLRRDDTGNGACELFLVEHVSKLDPDSISAATRLVRR